MGRIEKQSREYLRLNLNWLVVNLNHCKLHIGRWNRKLISGRESTKGESPVQWTLFIWWGYWRNAFLGVTNWFLKHGHNFNENLIYHFQVNLVPGLARKRTCFLCVFCSDHGGWVLKCNLIDHFACHLPVVSKKSRNACSRKRRKKSEESWEGKSWKTGSLGHL